MVINARIDSTTRVNAGRDRSHGIARRPRTPTHSLFERDSMAQKSVVKKKRLSAIDESRQSRPQVLTLGDQRRYDQEPHEHQNGDDHQIDEQDRKPPGRPPSPGRECHPHLDGMDERSNPDCEEHTDVDEDKGMARQIERPQNSDAQESYGYGADDG